MVSEERVRRVGAGGVFHLCCTCAVLSGGWIEFPCCTGGSRTCLDLTDPRCRFECLILLEMVDASKPVAWASRRQSMSRVVVRAVRAS